VFYHDLATNGVLYLDLGLDLQVLSADLLLYVPMFARALLGDRRRPAGFREPLSQRIGRTTAESGRSSGSRPLDSQVAAARLFLRAKAVLKKAGECWQSCAMSFLRRILTIRNACSSWF
jgi:presequence protease